MLKTRIRIVLIGLIVIARSAAAQTQISPARVLHISQAPLAGVDADRQFRRIADAAVAVKSGDTVMIHSGVYRESVVVGASGTTAQPITFTTAPAANVVVTGADRLTDWQREPGEDNIYSTPWTHSFINYSPVHAHPDDDYHLLIGRAEQVFVKGYALRQVLRREQLGRGAFFADPVAKRLFVWTSGNEKLTDVPVEASTRDVLWRVTGQHVVTRGIRFRYAANAAQQGAVQLAGVGDALRDCIVDRTNGVGASFQATDLAIERCTFRENGQMGFGAAHIDRSHFRDCTIEDNNTKDFSRGWEAGGEKIVLTRGAMTEHCRVLRNRGVGLWFDIGNEGCEVHNCLIADNEDAGIFYEISYGLYAHDNVIVGNGFADSPGAWGAQAGICLSSSPGCRIERNLLVGNREGFDFREQSRTTPRLDAAPGAGEVAVWNYDETVSHNVLAANRDAQTWGWFDVTDEMHWPLALQEQKQAVVAASPIVDRARPSLATDCPTRPPGLSLEKLHLTFSENLYEANDARGLFNWGVGWRRHVYYDSLDAVRAALSLEQGSVVAPFLFCDYLTRDFRVPARSDALRMQCYPVGDVPDVRLGIAPADVP